MSRYERVTLNFLLVPGVGSSESQTELGKDFGWVVLSAMDST